jgi:hypothetical protein
MMMPGYTRSVQVPEKCSIFGTVCRKKEMKGNTPQLFFMVS